MITPGASADLVTAKVAVGLFPQLLLAVQVTFPVTVPADMFTCKVVVPCPEVIVIPVTPVGTVQV